MHPVHILPKGTDSQQRHAQVWRDGIQPWQKHKFEAQDLCNREILVAKCFDVLYDDRQLMIQIDRSSGHMSRGPNALSSTIVNFSAGDLKNGKLKPGVRDTTVYEADFGKYIHHAAPGMMQGPNADACNRVQYGHYPLVGDNERYDSGGPHFDNKRRYG